MNTRNGITIALAGLGLGLLGDLLLRNGTVGLNGTLWVSAVLAGLLLLSRQMGVPLAGDGRWLVVPALLLTVSYTWHDSEPLMLFSTLGLLACMVLVMTTAREGQLREAGLADYALHGIVAGGMAVAGPLLLLADDIKWGELPRGGSYAKVGAVIKGLIIAVPLLLIFGALLVAADAVFERIVVNAIDFDFGDIPSHVMLTGFLGWLAAAFLRHTLAGKPISLPQGAARPAALHLGPVETGIVLGLLNALFLAFVLVQFRYFFGGSALVEASAGMTYAEYARRGFFELVGVTALVLPLLLLLHWLQPAENRLFRWLAGSMIALLCVIMLSALQRMRLYQLEFGLTELRLYATLFMFWLGSLFAWFAATVLRGQRQRFAVGALVTGLALVLSLQLLSPDTFIVRTNLNRLAEGKSFDGPYAASLSADVVPLLVDALPRMEPDQQQAVTETLLSRWGETRREKLDWRSWNWSRARAIRAVEELQPQAAAAQP